MYILFSDWINPAPASGSDDPISGYHEFTIDPGKTCDFSITLSAYTRRREGDGFDF